MSVHGTQNVRRHKGKVKDNMGKFKKKSTYLTDSDVAIVPREPEFPTEETESSQDAHRVSAQTETQTEQPVAANPSTNTSTGFVFGESEVLGRPGRKAQLTYPIGSLTADSNQYFDVAVNTSDTKKVKATLASIRAFAYRNGFAVTLREVTGAVRVWRKGQKATRNKAA
jgi:hypothetical protein